jgi:hypothetical protein
MQLKFACLTSQANHLMPLQLDMEDNEFIDVLQHQVHTSHWLQSRSQGTAFAKGGCAVYRITPQQHS